ncbi:MAG: methyltransferase domain-containing protein [Proteobacteria bacterium]|nr:methyltransferase domain-containing protein [Pseudomonadota bacterium]
MSDKKYKKVSRTDIALPQQVIQAINGHLGENRRDLFLIPFARQIMTHFRYHALTDDSFEFHQALDDAVIPDTIEYNRRQLMDGAGMERPRLLIDVVKSLHHVATRISEMRVLCIGPRSENEIFMLIGNGFDPEKICGLDLISYSEFVDAGDMHEMPYPDGSFDIVIVGWVLGYSKEPARVAKEIRRVAKFGAVIAIGVEHDPSTEENPQQGFNLEGFKFSNTDEITALFGDSIHSVYFRHDVHRTMADTMCHLMVAFELV